MPRKGPLTPGNWIAIVTLFVALGLLIWNKFGHVEARLGLLQGKVDVIEHRLLGAMGNDAEQKQARK